MLTNQITPKILFMIWLGSAGQAATPPSCAELEGAKPQVQLQYLQHDPASLDPKCIAYAMDQIGLKHYAPAIRTLITYLDYRLPDDPTKPPRALISRTLTLGDTYPACSAVLGITGSRM